MDLSTAIFGVNYPAVLVAAIAIYVLRIVWYSPNLFGTLWKGASGLTEEKSQQGSPGLIFGTAFILGLVATFVLALFLGPQSTLSLGVQAGFMVGLFWFGTALGVVYLHERRSLRLWLVNTGYWTLAFAVIGGILGAWHI